MAKRVGHAVVGRGGQHRHFFTHSVVDGHDICTGLLGVGVDHHVKQRKFDLPQGLQATLEMLGRQHALEQGAVQGSACLDMGGHGFNDGPFPAEVLHELAGQLHRIPFHAADARDIAFIDLGEQVVQAVATFVKEGDHIVMGQQRRLTSHAV